MVKGICFDLFWTLVKPQFQKETEYEALKMSQEEYESVYEARDFNISRNMGQCMDKYQLAKIVAPFFKRKCSDEELKLMIDRRSERLFICLTNVDLKILNVLNSLKNMGIKLCLVSNADCMDKEYWNLSPLSKIFENVLFSCDEKCMKPQKEIYERALKKINLNASQCLFVGDGGHDELLGAKEAGFKTVFTEYFIKKDKALRSRILQSANYVIDDFEELLEIIKK